VLNKLSKKHIILLILVISLIALIFVGCIPNGTTTTATDVVISFDTVGGSAIAPRSIKTNISQLNLPTPSKIGYDFVGWYNDAAYSDMVRTAVIPTENCTFYARWEKRSITVTFVGDNNSTFVDVLFGDNLEIADMPEVPAKTGYSGVWDTTALADITENITIHAIYTMLDGNIYYLVDEDDADANYTYSNITGTSFDGHLIYNNQTGVPNTSATFPSVRPIKTNYYFAGWYYDIYHNYPCQQLPSVIPLGSTILYAYFIDVNDMPKYFTYTQTTTDICITGLTNEGKLKSTLVVPEIINGKPVTSIGTIATSGKSASELNVFDSRYLASIIIPNSVKTIGSFAFSKCTSLTNVTIDGNALTTIGTGAFAGCTNIINFVLPDSVMTINDYAFAGITLEANDNPIILDLSANDWRTLETWYLVDMKLNSFVINNTSSLNNLSNRFLYNTPNLSILNIPNTISIINNQIFDGTSLNEIYIYAGNAELQNINSAVYSSDGKTLLYYPSKGNSSITLATTTENIAPFAFYNTTTLTNVITNSLLKTIGTYAFSNSTSLSTINLENSALVSIDEYAFSNLNNLVSVTFPASLRTIANHSFENCTGLTSVIFNGNQINSINPYSFYNCTSLQSIAIPQYVSTIGNNAFNNCNSLENVTFNMNSTLQYINSYAFTNCTSLNPLTLPSTLLSIGDYAFASVADKDGTITPNNAGVSFEDTPSLTSIGNYAFQYNQGITTVKLPSSLNFMGIGIFYNCSKINNLLLINILTIPTIPAYTFYGCNSINKNVIFPTTITEIGNYAFYNCEKIPTIKFSNIQTIGTHAFENCIMLNEGPTNEILPQSITSLGEYAFANCQNITTVDIPNGLVSISENAFNSCKLLALVRFNSGCIIETIKENAFANCTSLTTFDIPATLLARSENTGFVKNPFIGCTNLVEFTAVNSNNNNIVAINGVLYTIGDIINSDQTYSIYAYPTGLGGSLEIATNITSIENYAFYGSAIDQLTFAINTISDNKMSLFLTSIGDYAFSKSSDLASVILSSKIINVGDYAFAENPKLQTLIISNTEITNGATIAATPTATYEILNNSVAENNKLALGHNSFDSCAITSLFIPSRVTAIGNNAFSNCYNMLSANFATSDFNDDLTIGDYAFYRDNGLTSLILPSTLSAIGNYSFAWCVNIINIRFTYKVGKTLTIGQYAFNNCNYLYEIEFPASLISLGKGVFSQNTRLKYVTFPNTITTTIDNNGQMIIPEDAFLDATSLESITIPKYVSEIGKSSFANLKIHELIIENDSTSLKIGDYALSGLTNLSSITTTRTLELYKYALYNTPITQLNATILRLDNYALSRTNLSTFTIDSTCFIDSMDVIGEGCFADTLYLNNITINLIGNNIQIPAYCFENSIISTITFTAVPQTLILGDYCFANTPNLVNILFLNTSGANLSATNEINIGDSSFKNNAITNININSDNLLTINENAFSYMPKIQSIIANADTIIDIGKFAFSNSPKLNCLEITATTQISNLSDGFISFTSNLQEITLLDTSSKYIVEDNVVYNAHNNSLVAYPSGKKGSTYQIKLDTTTLNDYAFAGNTNLSNLILVGDTVITKNENTFKSTGTIKIFVPSDLIDSYINQWQTTNVSYINVDFDNMLLRLISGNNYAVEKYTGVDVNLTINNIIVVGEVTYKIVSIDDNAFKNNAILQTVLIKNGINELGTYSFANCVNLTSVTMESVFYINRYAFNNCTKLSTVTFAQGLTDINAFAFNNCSKLDNLIFPDSLISISNSSFANCTSLINIELPSSLTTIGANGFANCSNLVKITIPQKVNYIGNYAFANCSNLTFVYMQTEMVPKISIETFSKTQESMTILVPERLKVDFQSTLYWRNFAKTILINENIYLGSYVLQKISDTNNYQLACILDESYSNLPHIIDGKTVTVIGKNAISRFATTLTIEEGYQIINDYAFACSKNISTVNLPSTITSIGNHAFYNCNALSELSISNSPSISALTTIGDYAFYNTNLNHISIPSKVNYIGKYALSADLSTSLSTITFNLLPNSSVSLTIDDYAFKNNQLLREIVFNGYVMQLGIGAFDNCLSLNKIEFNSISDAPATKDDTTLFANCTSLSVFVPNIEMSYKFKGAFTNSNDKTKIVVISNMIRDTTNSIKYEKQNGMRVVVDTYNYFVYNMLSSTNCVEIINYIGEYTGDFIDYQNTADDAPRDSDIIIPSTILVGGTTYFVTKIGSYAFNNVITSVSIPDSISEISSFAFYKATSLRQISIGSQSQLKTIGAKAFAYCTSLTNIYFPKSITSIGDSAFYYCENLSSVTFENLLASDVETKLVLNDYIFSYCTLLTTISLPKHLESLGGYAFSNCTLLSNIDFQFDEDGADQIIKDYCFENTALKTITLPSTIRSVGDYAFKDCSDLKSVYICRINDTHNSLTSTRSHVFNGISNPFIRVYVPLSVLTNYAAIEGWNTKSVLANQADNSNMFNYQIAYGAAIITNFISDNTIINIPKSIEITAFGETNNYNISTIAALAGNANIEEIRFSLDSEINAIAENAFAYCTSLIKIVLPNSLNIIGKNAFTHCSSLTDIVLPNSIDTLINRTFTYCSSLKEITIPSNITTISEACFSNCPSLNRVIVESTTIHSLGSGVFDNTNSHLVVIVPTALKASYKNEWTKYANKIYARSEMYGDYVYTDTAEGIVIKQYNGDKLLIDNATIDSIEILGKKIINFEQATCVNPNTIIDWRING